MVRQQLDAGGCSPGFDRRSTLDLRHEGRDIGFRVRRGEIAGKLQQGDHGRVALRRGFPVRYRVAPDPERALELGSKSIDEWHAGVRPSPRPTSSPAPDVQPVAGSSLARRKRTRDAHGPSDFGPPEEPLAADMERDAGPPEGVLERRQLGVRPDEDRHRAVGDADRASARTAPAMPATSPSACGNPPISAAGPPGSVGTSRFGGRHEVPGSRSSGADRPAASTRFAKPSTSGVER